jgi:hypothetical protein
MEKSPDSFYTNNVNVTTSVYDVTLRFTTRTPFGEGEELKVEDMATLNVTMSPQHAKALAAILIKHVHDYEREMNIELPLTDSVRQLWDEIGQSYGQD